MRAGVKERRFREEAKMSNTFTPEQLDIAIRLALNADGFLAMCERLSHTTD